MQIKKERILKSDSRQKELSKDVKRVLSVGVVKKFQSNMTAYEKALDKYLRKAVK